MRKKALSLALALTFSLSVFTSSSSAEEINKVQIGNALWGISQVFNLSIEELQQISEIDSTWKYPEQTLSIVKGDERPKDQHLIEKGDTLFNIAHTNNVTIEELKEWNNLSSDLIFAGELLAIKASAAKPKPKPTVNKVKKPATTTKEVSAATNGTGKTLSMRATAYTAYCEGCSGITANGTDIRSNPNLKVIAVDPRVIPLGTKVWVEGYGEAIAADTGGAIKGNKIDVFIPSEGQARKWGVKQVTVKILK